MICHTIGLSRIRTDPDQLVYVLLSVFVEKIPIFYLDSKIFLSRSCRDRGYLISFVYDLSLSSLLS